jgi:hypothetical protein
MTVLFLHGRKIETIFDLLGREENDMTYALGWALAESPQFLRQLGETLALVQGFSERVRIHLRLWRCQLCRCCREVPQVFSPYRRHWGRLALRTAELHGVSV